MDSLRIRKKDEEQDPDAPEPPSTEAPPDRVEAPLAPPSGGGQAAADALALEGALAARLRDLPAADDERFTTWRPGEGAPPLAAAPPPVKAPHPRPADFALISSLGGTLSPLAGTAPGGGTLSPLDACAPSPAVAPAARAADPLDDFFYREDEEAPEVPAVGAGLGAGPGGEREPVVREEYLTFVLGDEDYAVAIERVREVMRSPPITEVPHAPPDVLGVVTVRGEVVAVFDPRRRLALPGSTPAAGAGRVVIVDTGEGPAGLLVDAVANVVRLRPGTIEPCPQGIGGASADCLAGIGRHGERLFTVIDLGAFLRRPPDGPRRRAAEARHAGS